MSAKGAQFLDLACQGGSSPPSPVTYTTAGNPILLQRGC